MMPSDTRSKRAVNDSSDSRVPNEPPAIDLQAMFEKLEKTIKENQEKTDKKLNELEKSQIFISNQYDAIDKKIDSILSLKQDVVMLKNLLQKKDEEIKSLENRVLNLEQYSRRSCVEFREVIQAENEDVETIIENAAKILNIPLTRNDIDAAHRLKTAPGKTPVIIAKFHSRKIRDKFIENKRKTITNNDVIGKGSGKIYIGESLAPYYRELLWKAKMKAKAENYKFVWWKNDTILVRKEEQGPIIRIKTEEDIEKISNLGIQNSGVKTSK